MPSKQDVLSRVRSKYPEYDSVADDDLYQRLIVKYPEYAEDAPSPSPVDTSKQDFAEQYLASQPSGGLGGAIQALLAPSAATLQAAKGLGQVAYGGAEGLGETLGSGSVAPQQDATLTQKVIEALTGILPGGQLLTGQQRRNLVQTGLEVAPRAALQLGGALRQAGSFATQEPIQAIQNVNAFVNPLQAAISQLNNGPRTISDEEINRAFQRQKEAQQLTGALQQPVVPEVIGQTNIPLAESIPLLVGTEDVPALLAKGAEKGAGTIIKGAQKVASRGFLSAPFEDVVTKTIGIEPINGGVETATVATNRILETTGKIPEGATNTVAAAKETQTNLLNDAKFHLRAARDQGLVMKGNEGLAEARTALVEKYPSLADKPAEVDKMLEEFSYLNKELDPLNGQASLRELNRRYDALENKETPQAFLYKQIRSSLSNQLDDLVKASSGLDISPYRDWGTVEEFKNGIQEQAASAQRSQAGKKPSGGTGIPTTQRGVIARAAKSLPGARALVPREIEAIDSGIGRIFKESPRLPSSPALDPQVVAELQQRLRGAKAKTPPRLPGVPPPLAPSLNSQIEDLIKTYPADIRNNPALARKVAESDLAAQSQ